MPIKKDETGRRWVEMEVLVPGTPEQVWHAMATGPGYAAWFVKGAIEPKVGGAVSLDFGQGAVTSGEVSVWEPPYKFSYVESDWQGGAPPVLTEITITSRSGDRRVVRMVHSLFTSLDDWDDQVESFESGWPGFFAVLRIYLEHFAGMNATSFIIEAPTSADSLSVWLRLNEALSLTGANVGERRTALSGPDHWSGVVEHVHQDAQQRYVLLRLDAPTAGVALVGTYDRGTSTSVSVCRYFYGNNVDALASACDARWRDWLARTFETPGVSQGAAQGAAQ